MKPKITRTTGTVVLRTKAKPKPCTAGWPKGDELDALMRKWKMTVGYCEPSGDYAGWYFARRDFFQFEHGRTPLSAARKLARWLEKEARP